MRRRRPPKTHRPKTAEHVLMVETLSPAGEGLARGIRIPFALPREEVRVRVSGQSGRVLERGKTADERWEPVCQHFGRPGDGCGGCTLQHLGAEHALRIKKERLLTAVRRVYPEAQIAACHVSPPQSRRRAKLAVEPGRAGLRELGGTRIVRLEDCAVLTPSIFALLRPLERLAAGLGLRFEAQVTAAENGADIALMGPGEAELTLPQRERLARFAEEENLARLSFGGVTQAERQVPRVTIDGLTVPLPAGAFLQATETGETALTREVLAAMPREGVVADLFCGLGTFALPMSASCEVFAADLAGGAIDALAQAARAARRRVVTEARDLFRRPLQAGELARFRAVVFDPPRAGAEAQAPLIAGAGTQTVVAVSCEPKSLARDLRHFAGGYDLARLVLVDQFGWSPHIEAVAVLERRNHGARGKS